MAASPGCRGVHRLLRIAYQRHPVQVVARLLRAASGMGDLDGQTARAQVRVRAPDAEPEDLVLFDDLLGIADSDAELPKIDPDARRRRLTRAG